MGAAEEKLVPQIEQMLPKMDSILYSLNKILADPALSATLHNAEKLTANLDVTTRQLNMLMQKDLPQLTNYWIMNWERNVEKQPLAQVQ